VRYSLGADFGIIRIRWRLLKQTLDTPYHISSCYSMDLVMLSFTVSLISYPAMLRSLVVGVHTCVPRMHSRTLMISLCLFPYIVPCFPSFLPFFPFLLSSIKTLVLFVSHNAISNSSTCTMALLLILSPLS